MTWQELRVAPSGTHHLLAEQPAYAERFDEVLPFHAPGLAPVRHDGAAWHIHSDGQAAYARRFRRTFGFYEGLAAVVGPDGWHHVHPSGIDAYRQRYAFCGNFQGGRCVVREPDGDYRHITPAGELAYAERFRYVGDFRDGIAVVQGEDGRSTHIDRDGRRVHGRWFLDLDVFHKGFARARDDDGWMHIDIAGNPRYAQRFAAVEPFYNGQARVERFDGGLEVIDETGVPLIELRPALRSEFAALSADMVGFWRTQTIATSVELGLFEALPGSVEDLAARCSLRPDRTRRLLRALGELSLVETVGQRFQPTPRGEYLRVEHPLTLAGAAREYGQFCTQLWQSLPQALRSQEEWGAPDIFGQVARDEARCEAHHRMLLSYARHDYVDVPEALRLRGSERVMDAGGGLGALAESLIEQYPKLHVILLDRPEVIAQARERSPKRDRIEWQSGDLFQSWGIDADAVILCRILHDWNDTDALRILRRAREVLSPSGQLFVVEMLLPEAGVAGSLCDLHLLMMTGGQERTATEYEALLNQAGFTLCEVRRMAALPAILVGEAR